MIGWQCPIDDGLDTRRLIVQRTEGEEGRFVVFGRIVSLQVLPGSDILQGEALASDVLDFPDSTIVNILTVGLLCISQDEATVAGHGLRVQIARLSPDAIFCILRRDETKQIFTRHAAIDQLKQIASVALNESLVIGVVA